MSKTICIPQSGEIFTLREDWQIELDWDHSNLRMLAAFNLTGMKRVEVGSNIKYTDEGRPARDVNGQYQFEPVYQNRTVVNPIFKDYEGNTTPALVTFPKGTQFLVSKYATGRRGHIFSVSLKCMGSPRKGLKTRCMILDLDVINGAPID
jgi:hypothetical protein